MSWNGAAAIDAWMTFGGVCAFSLVWLGLARSIQAIARRDRNPPSFHPLLNGAHMGRFGGWALVGAATLGTDVWTAVLLLSTRIPGVLLVAVTFLQRRECRPSSGRVARTLVPVFVGLVGACAAVAWLQPRLAFASLPPAFDFLPPATWLQYGLNAFVVLCFAVQIFYALPLQIAAALHKPLGNLRWFQIGLLGNYGYTLLYSARVQDELVGSVMAGAYTALLMEQMVLVALIERGVYRLRRAAG